MVAIENICLPSCAIRRYVKSICKGKANNTNI